MIQTSEAYNPYTTVRDVDMVVTFPALSESAATYATYSSQYKESISDLSQLNNLNYTDTKWATCENGLTLLDGTFRFLPDVLTNEQIGWWSNTLSSSYPAIYGEGYELGNTSLSISLPLAHKATVVGFTIYSSKTNPIKQCRVAVYDGTNKLFDEIFTADSEEMVIELPVADISFVEVYDIRTVEPKRRVKMLGFAFGIIKRWNRNNIVSASIEELSDYTGNTLPINTLKVELDNATHEFDLFGISKQYVYRAATNSVTVSAENAHEVAVPNIQTLSIIDGNAARYATCEDNFVMLSSSYEYVKDTGTGPYRMGYVNNVVSDDNGEFSLTPSVSYNWNNEINTSGFRIFFFEKNYATEVTVTAYNDNVVIDTTTVQNNDYILDINFAVSGCDKVTFTFGSVAEPNRFIKVSKIQVLRYVDSWGSYLTKRQKLIAEFIINGEHIPMGNSYLFDSLKQINGGLTAEITAKSAVAYLDNQKHDGEHGTTSLGTAMSTVLADTGISVVYSPANLSNTTVSKATPKNTTKRAATHYFAQAAMATCFFDRDGILNIKSLEATDYVDNIDMSNVYNSDIARMNEYVNMIRLTVKDEYTDPETSNTYYGGSGLYYRELQNNCVNTSSGTSVAQWLLRQYERRVYFEIETRGNPALELGDTIRITTLDGMRYIAVIYEQLFEYGESLKCTIKAVEATQN